MLFIFKIPNFYLPIILQENWTNNKVEIYFIGGKSSTWDTPHQSPWVLALDPHPGFLLICTSEKQEMMMALWQT